MKRYWTHAAVLALLVALPLLPTACRDRAPVVEAPGVSSPAGSIPQRTKEQNAALGLQHKTAWDLYQALKAEAKGGQRLTAAMMPDWSGVYSRPADKGFTFDPDTPQGVLTTAKLTPEYQAKLEKRVADVKRGIEWDPISTCAPPGHPRWLTEPFLREFVPAPNQTWLINEMVNDIRRVYTDGRDHVPSEDRYPLYNGDSIGFWDGPSLVVHTNQLQGGIYQRQNPDYTDQVETVEIWRKADDTTLIADVWVYDPPALAAPWYVQQRYAKLSDPDKALRIRYWNCAENQNNAVSQTKDGTTQFNGFTFDPARERNSAGTK
ncbi:MAG TPA: hypothetical protein VFD69_05410 [Vicinamibacterales bacterium]|nr:hypothetical protein [Vicinamibacterales bacterium]